MLYQKYRILQYFQQTISKVLISKYISAVAMRGATHVLEFNEAMSERLDVITRPAEH